MVQHLAMKACQVDNFLPLYATRKGLTASSPHGTQSAICLSKFGKSRADNRESRATERGRLNFIFTIEHTTIPLNFSIDCRCHY